VLHEKLYSCSGFKRIGKERIVCDFENNQLQFMMHDSLTPLDCKKYEHENKTYLVAVFDNSDKDNTAKDCFYASLEGRGLIKINTIT
jgi:hypothetical protein